MASDNLFWIECNTCPAQGPMLSLTECGHIYCLNCVEKLKSNKNKCLVCKRSTSYQTLDDTLPDSIKSFFKPWTIGSLMETVSNFQKIEKFHKNQIQLYARNSVKKQILLKKQLQSAHAKIQALLKDLSTKDECIKAYQARDKNEKTIPSQQCHSIAPSVISLKMSTPNSKAFINGILKNNSLNLNTSTPLDRNSTPINAKPRSTPVQTPTPTPFITPISSNNSTEKQRRINQQSQRQTLASSAFMRTPISQNKFTPNNQSQRPVSYSTNRMTQSKLKAPTPGGGGLNPMALPSKMDQSRHLLEPSPALMSYRKLIQDRANIGMGSIKKDVLNSGMSSCSQSSCSLQMKSAVKSNLGVFSNVSRKRRNYMI